MGHRLMTIYNLLKAEQIGRDGVSAKKIIDRVCAEYNINLGKGIRRQVLTALRRGVDYGILTKTRNKYRFDPTSSMVAGWKSRKSNRRVRRKSKVKAKANKRRERKKEGRKRVRSNSERREKVPRPRVPPAPTWTAKKRNLLEEVLPKVRKYSSPK
ncbi:uncharacterized protein LOC112493701 [Cephus cinctus]|uniref:Uncharacterized protein LOC112493701 n=1 Tax=Cephus cinctus TaxID=211228 RepID=A0AAJ7R8B6_CEPCN|nr:uncharacterized protein LOC112493701 [Cephus cinctus]